MENLIRTIIKETLDEMELRYSNEGNLFFLTMCSSKATFRIQIIADDSKELFAIVGHFPVNVPKARLGDMYGVANYINREMRAAKVVIDPEDGELTMRVIANADSDAINKEVVTACIGEIIYYLEDKYDEIMMAMFSGE